MKRILNLFAFYLLLNGFASAQESAQPVRATTQTVATPARHFESLVARLHQAYDAADEANLIARESAVLTALREELDRAEAAASPNLGRQREIFAAFEHFSFFRAKPADAEPRFRLLEEFAGLMQ